MRGFETDLPALTGLNTGLAPDTPSDETLRCVPGNYYCFYGFYTW